MTKTAFSFHSENCAELFFKITEVAWIRYSFVILANVHMWLWNFSLRRGGGELAEQLLSIAALVALAYISF